MYIYKKIYFLKKLSCNTKQILKMVAKDANFHLFTLYLLFALRGKVLIRLNEKLTSIDENISKANK
jgi:hypothetical protein